jgi:hypothetical protein
MDFFSRIAILLSRASRIGSASCQNGKLWQFAEPIGTQNEIKAYGADRFLSERAVSPHTHNIIHTRWICTQEEHLPLLNNIIIIHKVTISASK